LGYNSMLAIMGQDWRDSGGWVVFDRDGVSTGEDAGPSEPPHAAGG